MGLFKRSGELSAVCDGTSIPLSEIPDEAFATGLLGVGCGIEPQNGNFYAPVDGRIESVSKTLHAYTVTSREGLDILIHIGVDTVRLGGEGFTPLVKAGDSVKKGQLIAKVDLERIKQANLPTVTALLISDSDHVSDIDYRYGDVLGGKDSVMYFRFTKKG